MPGDTYCNRFCPFLEDSRPSAFGEFLSKALENVLSACRGSSWLRSLRAPARKLSRLAAPRALKFKTPPRAHKRAPLTLVPVNRPSTGLPSSSTI